MNDANTPETASSTVVTADQLLTLGEGLRELVRGEVVELTPAGGRHGKIEAEIVWRLMSFIRPHDLGQVFPGDTGFILASNPDTVRSPDVAFVRGQASAPQGYLSGAPDLAVEINSPNDRPGAVQEKVQSWLNHGSHAVWVVDPDAETVTCHRQDEAPRTLHGDDAIEEPALLPEFSIRARDCFPE